MYFRKRERVYDPFSALIDYLYVTHDTILSDFSLLHH